MKLPDTLHELLELALGDLKKQEEDGHVDMGNWLYVNDVCCACLAGSVMRFTLGIVPSRAGRYPDFIPEANKLYALNSLRGGCVSSAMDYMYCVNVDFPSWNICSYHVSREQWHKDIRDLLAYLKELGV